MPSRVLVIACGALAREIIALKRRYGWDHLDMQCIDARLHNRPALIPQRCNKKFVTMPVDMIGYTLPMPIAVPAVQSIECLRGAGRAPSRCPLLPVLCRRDRFAELSDAEPGTFYLDGFSRTNFRQARHAAAEARSHPELAECLFWQLPAPRVPVANDGSELLRAAKAAARRLELEFEHVHCGYGVLENGPEGYDD